MCNIKWGTGAIVISLCIALLWSCGTIRPPEPRPASDGHIGSQEVTPPPAAIPEPVLQTPFLPPPKPAPPVETYTVVVSEVPVKELLFALARDAEINIDIHPDIEGQVTMNAVDQSLPQILDRLSRQIDLRYELQENSLVISPDLEFYKTYRVDYLNITRETESTFNVSTGVFGTEVGGSSGRRGGGGGQDRQTDSTTQVENAVSFRLWETITETITSIVTGSASVEEAQGSGLVIPQAESGLIVVRATGRQHEAIQAYLDKLITNVRYQVLIEATIAEVDLNDDYQAGIDWEFFNDGGTGADIVQDLTSGFVEDASLVATVFTGDIEVTVDLLQTFGNVSVLSSPKLMALNNQTAVLKVVENVVYFEVDSTTLTTTNAPSDTSFSTTARTVPVGLVMNLTPQISQDDTITLNIRPSISRVARFVPDPNPDLEEVPNLVPQIETREFESVLRLDSGQVGILGGLMLDTVNKQTTGVPLLSDIPGLGKLFTSADDKFQKSELVIFVRARVIRSPSLQADLADFRRFLPENQLPSGANLLPTYQDGVGQ